MHYHPLLLLLDLTDGRRYAVNTHDGSLDWSVYGAAGPDPDKTCKTGSCFCALDSSPVLDTKGSLYFGESPTHTQKAGSVLLSVCGVHAGSMYGGGGGYLQAFYKNGTRKWQDNMELWVLGHPTIGSDDVVYIGSENGNFNAWYENGTKKWETSLGCSVYGAGEISDYNGNIYVSSYCGSSNGKMFALANKTGAKIWTATLPSIMKSGPVADKHTGTVYVGCYDKNIYALHPGTGATIWTFNLGLAVEATPIIGADGTIYIGGGVCPHMHSVVTDIFTLLPLGTSTIAACPTGGCFFYALTPAGQVKWKIAIGAGM